MTGNLFFVMEMIGTVAFAVSGGMLAIRKDLDLLGILVLSVTAACGGGMLRDLLIGITPPVLFVRPVYVAVAASSAAALFLSMRFLRAARGFLQSSRYDTMHSLSDAVGLGAFTVVGIDTALQAGFGEYRFLVIFLGVLTGVGGGVLRDIMVNETPGVLKRHIYACASLLGALVYERGMAFSRTGAMLVSFALVVLVRMLARHYRWNLPHVSSAG